MGNEQLEKGSQEDPLLTAAVMACVSSSSSWNCSLNSFQ